MTAASEAEFKDFWRECTHCGLFCRLGPRHPGEVAECPRCGTALWRMRRSHMNFPLACAMAGLLFYIFALMAPFLEIETYGRAAFARLETGPIRLTEGGWELLGTLVFIVTLIMPGVKLGIAIITLLGLETGLPRRLLKSLFRWYESISPWAMMDVYLLGFLVAYTRLTPMFNVHLDTALYALIGLMLSMAATDASLDQELVWRRLGHEDLPAERGEAQPIGCMVCGLVNHRPPGSPCLRCETILEPRKPASVARAWAYTIAAACLYVPANLYPIMNLTSMAKTQPYTIFTGIVELVKNGLWPVALLVFFASITIPLLKLVGMAYILVTCQRGSAQLTRGRTLAYKIINVIGRWSMIDIFMISILVALVHFGQIANVTADTGAVCFASVVILTIFAVDAFDPRLIWDNAGNAKEDHKA
jgi:paraquat-inducible protein A